MQFRQHYDTSLDLRNLGLFLFAMDLLFSPKKVVNRNFRKNGCDPPHNLPQTARFSQINKFYPE